jgi:hypothetical protein
MNSLTITVGWCSQFKVRAWHKGLMHADRPAALFMQQLGKYVAAVQALPVATLITDENFGTGTVAQEALTAVSAGDVAYLSSHGRFVKGDYRFRLRDGEWTVSGTLGSVGPRILVLDTCNLVESTKDLRSSSWLRNGQPTPAIVLGFVGAASAGFWSATRGKYFAENLVLGSTFATAWLDAVRATNSSGRDEPIALAFGPTEHDAKLTFDNASLTNWPALTVSDSCYWETR